MKSANGVHVKRELGQVYTGTPKEGKISVSEDRIKRFKNHLDVIQDDFMKGKVYLHAKTLAKIAGHIISMKAVFGDTVRFNPEVCMNAFHKKLVGIQL